MEVDVRVVAAVGSRDKVPSEEDECYV